MFGICIYLCISHGLQCLTYFANLYIRPNFGGTEMFTVFINYTTATTMYSDITSTTKALHWFRHVCRKTCTRLQSSSSKSVFLCFGRIRQFTKFSNCSCTRFDHYR